ncbi:MAG: dTDP-4-dehydrorhamnose reductase [Proteobacteria bacterium]|nr:dTDP-4-dehydrorhamnose reductase [Pseudomonadota bacterium]
MRILVLGARGQVATALSHAGSRANMEIATSGRPFLDVARRETIVKAIMDVRPDLVVNAAAYTAVDAAETHWAETFRVNETGAANAASAAAQANLPLIHLSTDYVFDGMKNAPYVESDVPAPCNVYGMSKLAGEDVVRAGHPAALVVRMGWIYSQRGRNFLCSMLSLAREKEEIAVVDDQIGCPTFADDAADGILELAKAIVREPLQGHLTLHMAVPDHASRFELAQEIFLRAKPLGLAATRLKRIDSSQFPLPARRPANSRLSSEQLARLYDVRLPAWRDGLARCMSSLARNPAGFA